MNLWQLIAGNSALPAQAGTNLWDHLNNQAGGVTVQAAEGVTAGLSSLGVRASMGVLEGSAEHELGGLDAGAGTGPLGGFGEIEVINVEGELNNVEG